MSRIKEAIGYESALQSSFTPGPWFCPTPLHGTFYVEARIDGGMLQEVASCGPTAEPSQQAANARLLAAAPELLEALTDCVEHMHWTQPQGEAALKKAKAAIAKATGSEA